MPTSPLITGTFLDEITHDIPSQNWGYEDWRREAIMQDELFIKLYSHLPKELIFQRELLVARL